MTNTPRPAAKAWCRCFRLGSRTTFFAQPGGQPQWAGVRQQSGLRDLSRGVAEDGPLQTLEFKLRLFGAKNVVQVLSGDGSGSTARGHACGKPQQGARQGLADSTLALERWPPRVGLEPCAAEGRVWARGRSRASRLTQTESQAGKDLGRGALRSQKGAHEPLPSQPIGQVRLPQGMGLRGVPGDACRARSLEMRRGLRVDGDLLCDMQTA